MPLVLRLLALKKRIFRRRYRSLHRQFASSMESSHPRSKLALIASRNDMYLVIRYIYIYVLSQRHVRIHKNAQRDKEICDGRRPLCWNIKAETRTNRARSRIKATAIFSVHEGQKHRDSCECSRNKILHASGNGRIQAEAAVRRTKEAARARCDLSRARSTFPQSAIVEGVQHAWRITRLISRDLVITARLRIPRTRLLACRLADPNRPSIWNHVKQMSDNESSHRRSSRGWSNAASRSAARQCALERSVDDLETRTCP